ncbi:unnamed protein product [Taenia asiatica]|uniref:Uncharacterized protein n=1 Tax=Taenia asiatica TaxID=60517 RepID=A0A0R3WHF3_TAEAS|nr:unnamed protein product [Taenia asiatica]
MDERMEEKKKENQLSLTTGASAGAGAGVDASAFCEVYERHVPRCHGLVNRRKHVTVHRGRTTNWPIGVVHNTWPSLLSGERGE